MNGKKLKRLLLVAMLVGASLPMTAQVQWTTVEKMGSIDTKENNKLGFIDFYTSWCDWCRQLDNTTFANDTVARILNKYYHAAKFDAESKDNVKWKGDVFKNPDLTKKTIHSFTKQLF